jgi:hypothetical protein
MQDTKTPLPRRALLGGAATAGALAVTATLLPSQPAADVRVSDASAKKADGGDGYQLTDHVKQYYKTTRI